MLPIHIPVARTFVLVGTAVIVMKMAIHNVRQHFFCALVPTGLFMALPAGYEAQVRPRSGLAIKKGITVLNSPGTVDADYRGEVCVILVNLSNEPFLITDGERIAQMVIARHEQVEWCEVDVLDETERGAGGFGHTGV